MIIKLSDKYCSITDVNFRLVLYLISCLFTGDGYGDACVDDMDGDGYLDAEDVCPEHKDIHSTDFRSFQTILLDPVGDSQIDPEWLILNQVYKSSTTVSISLIREQ